MASGAIYPPPKVLSSWELGVFPIEDYYPEYNPYASSQPLPQHPQHQQAYQVWAPSRFSTGSYPDPSVLDSPPPLRHSFFDDPAFARDPTTNPDNWYHAQSTTPFPARSHSGLDLPPGFVPQSGPDPNTSYRARSYHEQSPVPQPVYRMPPSVTPSSSTSGSSASAPRSSVRVSDYPHEYLDYSFGSVLRIEAPPDEGQSLPRTSTSKHTKRRSPRAAQPASDQAEEGSGPAIPSLIEPPADAGRNSSSLTSSMMVTGPAEQPKGSRARTSSRPTPAELDPIDELDKTNPLGFNVHHKGPYEAVAAILNEANPVDSPLLRVKGIHQQVSASASVRPSRRIKSEPTANPMALNLQPGQILENSIYQPMQATPFPAEFSQGAHHVNHDSRLSRGQVKQRVADYDTTTTGSPLRRNQTLPAASLAPGPVDQFYHMPPYVTSEVQAHQRSYLPVDHQSSVPAHSSARRRMSHMSGPPPYTPQPLNPHPSQFTEVKHATKRPPYVDVSHNNRPLLQVAPATSVVPPEVPPTPDIDQRFARTLYLTNPDDPTGAPGDRSHVLPWPQATRTPINSNSRNRGPSRNSPPDPAPTSDQDFPRLYEAPSQTVAAMNAQYMGKAGSATSSSSRTSSTLAPRHIPKRLVMPTPLAPSALSAPSTAPSASRANDARPGQVLRKRGTYHDLPRPKSQRSQSLPPPQTVNRGVFSFFRFGKGSKPTVREVHVTERSRVETNKKAEQQVRPRKEPQKLSKQRR
ncbi:hypothetical protein BC827DRAFT_1154201 [Russula dissimulans]|nr:hypothetical protein BC827DRAFT_1154201 [Russula dissimulans]